MKRVVLVCPCVSRPGDPFKEDTSNIGDHASHKYVLYYSKTIQRALEKAGIKADIIQNTIASSMEDASNDTFSGRELKAQLVDYDIILEMHTFHRRDCDAFLYVSFPHNKNRALDNELSRYFPAEIGKINFLCPIGTNQIYSLMKLNDSRRNHKDIIHWITMSIISVYYAK